MFEFEGSIALGYLQFMKYDTKVVISSIPPSPEYTPSVRYAVAADPRLEADLGHDLDFPMMRAALEGIFHWLDFMDFFAREMRRRQPHHLSVFQDAHSNALAQALHNRGWLT
ncbi:hypothetical protein LIER_04912 [Lithospermum erythrorhizon]|uniref:Uncharacterized protein n=1 Tax=Lithospermum erythrorhizon TaxID=34254 RepID=A0AAV3NZS9_LITER